MGDEAQPNFEQSYGIPIQIYKSSSEARTLISKDNRMDHELIALNKVGFEIAVLISLMRNESLFQISSPILTNLQTTCIHILHQ